MMKYRLDNRARLTRLATPQVERNRGTWLLTSAASAPSWPADEWERLDRFLIFGNDRGTRVLRGCVETDGPRVVRRVVELSTLGRVASNGPCLTALAMCVTLGNEATRGMALEAVPEVARTPGELGTFEQSLESTRGEQSGATPGIQRGGERGAVALIDAAAPHPRRTPAAAGSW
jgi:hypothetical protein